MRILQILVLILGLIIFVEAQTGGGKSVLTGGVYDASGALVTAAKVLLVKEKGEKFKAETNEAGVYVLNLPFNSIKEKSSAGFRIAKYEIIVDLTGRGFEKFVLRDFKFVPSTNGKMNLDIALDSLNPEPCGYSGADCPETAEIETPMPKISDKVLRKRPLAKSPKEQNKSKRKKKNNKR